MIAFFSPENADPICSIDKKEQGHIIERKTDRQIGLRKTKIVLHIPDAGEILFSELGKLIEFEGDKLSD
jgi:hypothetical protein